MTILIAAGRLAMNASTYEAVTAENVLTEENAAADES